MKKTFKFLGLTLTVLFVFIFIACKDDPPKGEEPVGYAKFGDKNIPIYAGEGVTEGEAIAFVTTINSGYNALIETERDTIKNKVKKIYVVAGGADNCSYANGIVNFGQDCSTIEVNGFLGSFVVTAKVIDNSKETVRMAFAAVNSKGNAKSI